MTTARERTVESASRQATDGLLQWLARPRSYPDPTHHVERIDTHISWVFLTDRYVYKLKKPVKYDFLDFSTTEMRRRACEAELRLNRRLARDVYLEVLPVTANKQGRLQWGGNGETVDWAVKMRRLPADRALDQRIRSGDVTQDDVHELASRLSEFYQQLPPLNIESDQYRRRLEEHILSNHRSLSVATVDEGILKRVHASQLRVLRLCRDLLDGRVCDGRIVDGHGDLRPEHIYFDPHPTIIDCIEFNDEFRQLDVLDELAFLAAECEFLGAGWIGDRVIQAYQAASGDRAPKILLEFYETYRACVRAKVLTLQSSQVDAARHDTALGLADRYLRLADRHASLLGPPMVLVSYGLSGTGKSTVATRLSELLAVDVLSTDAIRHDLFGDQVMSADYNQGAYQLEMRQQVYEEMFLRAERMLRQNTSVILDGTFPTAELRRQVVKLAHRHGAAALLGHCHCRIETARERIVSRGPESLSDASLEVFEQQRTEYQSDPAGLPVTYLDTEENLVDVIETVYRDLRPLVGLA